MYSQNITDLTKSGLFNYQYYQIKTREAIITANILSKIKKKVNFTGNEFSNEIRGVLGLNLSQGGERMLVMSAYDSKLINKSSSVTLGRYFLL